MSLDSEFPVLHDRPSIHEFIRSRLGTDGALEDPLCKLPDDAPRGPSNIAWIAGAFDGVAGHHAGGAGRDVDRAQQLADAIAAAAATPQLPQLEALYALATSDDVLSFIDPAIKALVDLRPLKADIGRIGRWLATCSPDRGPVKVGIALVGITGASGPELLLELGAHEEFALYSVVAFCNSRRDPEPQLFAMAKRLDGWGRIHCVERLRDTNDPEIARWILLEGFRNRIMYEYLAYIAATTGNLLGAISEPFPDRAVLTAIGEVITSLILGGPAENIDHYEPAPVALARWLEHMDDHAESLSDLKTMRWIRDFCDRDDWEKRLASTAWTAESRRSVQSHAVALIEHPRWPGCAERGLKSQHRDEFWDAVVAARQLGIDPFEELLSRIDANPLQGPWYQAWQTTTLQQAQILADRAVRYLDLDSIASGPSAAHGMGQGFEPHSVLGYSVQGLCAYPGVGGALVDAALQSPSTQNRFAALRALDAWGTAHWTARHHELLQQMAASDPLDRIQEQARELMHRLLGEQDQ